MSLDVKQVIVIRRDLKMRRGKEIAQGAHASAMWMLKRLTIDRFDNRGLWHESLFSEVEKAWINDLYRKVVCQVDSFEELKTLHDSATAAGLNSHLVTDAGATEFHDVPTITALAIGPALTPQIDAITKHLKLY